MSDTTDDMEMFAGVWEEAVEAREAQWESGYHSTMNGERVKITHMTDNHLVNTIKFFSGDFDTTVLEEELARRKRI